MSRIPCRTGDVNAALEAMQNRVEVVFVGPTGSTVEISDDGGRTYPVRMYMPASWNDADDLRAFAKLFKKLAKRLEREGRGN
jgi:hypothetical protein